MSSVYNIERYIYRMYRRYTSKRRRPRTECYIRQQIFSVAEWCTRKVNEGVECRL